MGKQDVWGKGKRERKGVRKLEKKAELRDGERRHGRQNPKCFEPIEVRADSAEVNEQVGVGLSA